MGRRRGRHSIIDFFVFPCKSSYTLKVYTSTDLGRLGLAAWPPGPQVISVYIHFGGSVTTWFFRRKCSYTLMGGGEAAAQSIICVVFPCKCSYTLIGGEAAIWGGLAWRPGRRAPRSSVYCVANDNMHVSPQMFVYTDGEAAWPPGFRYTDD